MGLILLLLTGAAVWVTAGTLAILHRLTHPFRLTYGVAVARQWPTSLEDVGLAGHESTLKLPDGHTTVAWIAQGEQADGPAVVITHGWGHSRYAVLPWMKQLAPFSSMVIAYDLRGQGESSAPRSHLGTTEVADLIAIVRACVPEGRQVVLAGQSMGGGVSIAAGADPSMSQRVAGVMVEGVYQRGMEPVVGHFRRKGWAIWPFYLPVAWHLSFWYMRGSRFDRAVHAARLRCPLWVLHGSDDPVCPLASARRIAQAAGERATMIVFPDAGHLDLAEADPKRYCDALRSFFEAVAVSGSPAISMKSLTGNESEP